MGATNYSSFNTLLTSFFVAFQFLSNVSVTFADGFYVDIIHRDSPESPLYDPSSTRFSRFQAAVNRSASRLHYLHHARFLDSISISLANNNFEYLMIFRIGSKSKEVFATIDTGSDFIWVLCDPCPNCYEHVPNIFHPLSSETYKKFDCQIPPCTQYHPMKCNNENMCEYHAEYLDGSFVDGILSSETFNFNVDAGNEVFTLHNVIFGCSHKTEGLFDRGSIGLVGLNRGPLTLTSQLGPSFGKRFSYCLSSKNNRRTRLYFGATATVSGPGAMITPMYHGKLKEQYYLLLWGIRVGHEEPILVSPEPQEGNIIFDSGSVMTYIQPNLLHPLIQKLKKHIALPLIHDNDFDLCFNTSSLTGSPNVPKITFMFDNNVDFVLNKHSVFKKINKKMMCCLISFTEGQNELQIIGNRAQMGYRVGFDVEHETIAIRNEDC